MRKDNEDVSPLDDGPPADASARSFTPEQMVRCDACLRANPPVRMNCLYCGAALPVQPSSVVLQKPELRPLEKWEHGYNNIHLPSSANLSESSLAEIADFLRLEKEELTRIVKAEMPLPLARSSSKDEAELILLRLKNAGVDSSIIADLSLGEDPPVKLRALEFTAEGIKGYQSPQAPPVGILLADLVLLVAGRITRRRVELKEERKGSERRVLDADQFFADENIVELFSGHNNVPYRIASGSFDFSCLGEKKRLVAAENMSILIDVLCEQVPALIYDQEYNSLRKALEPVWRSEQQNESTGWRRGRPGKKYSLGSVTETSNETQFSRYARLRYYLLVRQQMGAPDA